MDHIDTHLQETVICPSTQFDIAHYIKLDDSKLISNIDKAGPGASVTDSIPTQAKPAGKPGEWSVESFLEVL
jgi:hypothetical protein